MKKQKRQLIILLAILLVCILGYLGANFYTAWVEVQEEIAEADYAVLSFEDTELAQIHVEGSAGELIINYDGSTWTFENDINAEMAALNGTEETDAEADAAAEDADADAEADDAEDADAGADAEDADAEDSGEDAAETDAVDSTEDTVEYEVNATTASTLMGYLDSLTSEYAITPNEDLSEYGLTDPSMTITLTMTDGTVHTLVFGDYNEMLGEYYYYVDDASTLYTISSYTYNILNKTDTDLADEVEEEEEESEEEDEAGSEDEADDAAEDAEDTADESDSDDAGDSADESDGGDASAEDAGE